jgi:hypothetical protein
MTWDVSGPHTPSTRSPASPVCRSPPVEGSEDGEGEGDRFENCGVSMIQAIVFKAIDQLRDLPPGEVENYANSFRETAEKLVEKQRALSFRQREHPIELPDPLTKANVKEFPKSRKRAMTGAEVTEWRELEIRREERRAAMQDTASTAAEGIEAS